MYHIAVCDDEAALCSHFERVLEKYIGDRSISFECFYSGEELTAYLRRGEHLDLIFLDIELKLMNGVAVGKIIREELEDDSVQIVYISAKQQYAMELFEIRPMNFLVKPVSEEKIIKSVEKAMKLAGINGNCFELKQGREVVRIPYGEIVYFESDNRKIIIHTEQGSYEMYGKLNAIEEAAPETYVRIHQSFLVNSLKIRRWSSEAVWTCLNPALPVSKSCHKKVVDFLLKREE